MSASLDALIAKLAQSQTEYTPLTRSQMQEQANRRYQSLYDQKRLVTRQQYETDDAALVRQLAEIQESYDRQRAQSDQTYREAGAQAERQALSRGMQRSSYNSATLAGISRASGAARQELGRQQAGEERNVGEKRGLLASQLTQRLNQLNESQSADVLAYLDQLEAREYDRGAASRKNQNDLSMKIYEYQHQLEQEAEAASRWRQEFDAKYGGKASGGGGGGKKKKQTGGLGSLLLGDGVKA